nr:hypothetical protein [Tanacetum cinerariifolium]
LKDEAQAENEDFINKLDENINKIIKEQVKVQVKKQVSKILPRIKKFVNEQLKVEVLTRSSNKAKISHDVAANLSELELKKILIDKMKRGPREEELEKKMSQLVHQRRRLLSQPARLKKGLSLKKKPAKPPTPNRDWNKTLPAVHGPIQPYINTLARNEDPRRRVIPFDHFINNDLAYLSGGVSSRTYTNSVTKTKAANYRHIKWIEDLVPNTMWSQVKSARDVYSRNRIIAIKKLAIVEWHNYKHLEWISVCRDDDKLYTFKNEDYNRLHLQDIKDMLLLLVQGKLTNLNIEERLALGVSLRMFTRSIFIKRHVEDL